MIPLVRTGDPEIAHLLASHPEVGLIEPGPPGLHWTEGSRERAVLADAYVEVAGLPELMDNNPMVCADVVGVPGPVETAALIALGPLIRGGVVADSPVLVGSEPFDGPALQELLAREGWTGGGSLTVVPSPDPRVVALQAMVRVDDDVDDDALRALFDERFGRAYFVRRVEGALNSELVVGAPFALYSVEFDGTGVERIAVIRVVLDPRGKGGPAQMVHVFDVMCGYEETLGLV